MTDVKLTADSAALAQAWTPKGYGPLDYDGVLTGSHAYGTPTEDSDVDLVVLMAEPEARRLAELLGVNRPADEKVYPTIQFRLGKLNLIVETDPARLAIWRRGTRALKAEAPVTRERAVAVFSAMRDAADVMPCP